MSRLEAEALSIAFGGIAAVSEVSLTAVPGEILSIIGPNGAGKTTLFNLISGLYPPDRGRVRLGERDVTGLPPHALAAHGLSRTFQNLQIFFRMTALENVMVGRHRHERAGLVASLLRLPAIARQDEATRTQSLELLARVGLVGVADAPAGNLAFGALKRLEIARALATEPSFLLLDEPAAGCNSVETAELDALIVALAREGIGIVLVEHDMRLVMRVSHRILVLSQGRAVCLGPPSEVARDPRVIEAYLGSEPACAGG